MKKIIALCLLGFALAGCNFGGEENPYDELPDFYQPINGIETAENKIESTESIGFVIDISDSVEKVQQTVSSHNAKPGRLGKNN